MMKTQPLATAQFFRGRFLIAFLAYAIAFTFIWEVIVGGLLLALFFGQVGGGASASGGSSCPWGCDNLLGFLFYVPPFFLGIIAYLISKSLKVGIVYLVIGFLILGAPYGLLWLVSR